MNNIRQTLQACVAEHNYYGDQTTTYDEIYQSTASDTVYGGRERRLTDLVTLVAWTTDTDSIQDMMLLNMSNPTPMAFRVSFESGICSPPHTHNYIELMYVLEGQVTQNIRGENVSFSQGEICLVNTQVEHCEYLYAQNTTVLWLGIDDVFFEKYERGSDPTDYTQSLKKLINQKRFQYLYIRFTPTRENTQTTQAFETIFYEMLQNLPGKNRLIIGYVERIVDLLTREYHVNISQEDRKELHQAIIADICDYIAGNFAKTSVQQIASVYHYSPDYLNRIFSRETGRTISSYLQKIRMEHAMRIIQTTTIPVEQAARQSGYHNLGFFYKKFREFYLCTPDEARKQFRTSPGAVKKAHDVPAPMPGSVSTPASFAPAADESR